MNSAPQARILPAVALLVLFVLSPVFSESADHGVQVRTTSPAVVETKPLKSFTLVFCVGNQTENKRTFLSNILLPEGWKPVIADTPFELEPNEESVRLVSVIVPVRALAGDYRVGYEVVASDDPAISGRTEAAVRVLLEARLQVEATEAHHLVIAGETYRSAFVVKNLSNAALDVNFSVRSNGPGCRLGVEKMPFEPGESRSVEIAVALDRSLSRKFSQFVELTAEAFVPETGKVKAGAVTEFEVIPRVSGRGDYFNKLPAEVGFLAVRNPDLKQYGQFKFSGAGSLDQAGRHNLDFFFRGPGRGQGRESLYQFGFQREEYRLRYGSPNIDVFAGDRVFHLTRLTENGHYGRGFEAELTVNRWSLRGYFKRNILYNEVITGKDKEKAFQLSYKPGEKMAFDISYLSSRDSQKPEAYKIFSLQSRLSFGSPLNLRLEYSWDWTDSKKFGRANTAVWLEGSGTYGKMHSRVNLIRSGADYHGYYDNLDYNSAELSYAHSEKWGLRASLLEHKRKTGIEPYVEPFADRTFQAGAYHKTFKRLSFSLDWRSHERQDLSLLKTYDYRDTSLRLGSFYYLGTFSLQSYIDIGRTYNRLTLLSQGLVEYTVQANYLAFNSLSLSGYIHYRDQDIAFTGDKLRQFNIYFSLGLNLGRADLNAFYRTAIIRDLYRSAFSRQDFDDPSFLLKNYDVFGAELTYRFRNGYSVSARVQQVANGLFPGLPVGKRIISLIEFKMPVGIPVNRKKTVGQLKGRVYDAENGRRGVEGVIVKANDLAAVTDQKGDFVFNGLDPGSYTLALDERRISSGKVSIEKMPVNLVVEGGKKVEFSTGLVTGSSISGRVVVCDYENGTLLKTVKSEQEMPGSSAGHSEVGKTSDDALPRLIEKGPIAGVSVVLRGEDTLLYDVTDERGRFFFGCLRPGKYVVSVADADLPELHVFESDSIELALQPAAEETAAFRVIPVVRQVQVIEQGEVKVRIKKDSSA